MSGSLCWDFNHDKEIEEALISAFRTGLWTKNNTLCLGVEPSFHVYRILVDA